MVLLMRFENSVLGFNCQTSIIALSTTLFDDNFQISDLIKIIDIGYLTSGTVLIMHYYLLVGIVLIHIFTKFAVQLVRSVIS